MIIEIACEFACVWGHRHDNRMRSLESHVNLYVFGVIVLIVSDHWNSVWLTSISIGSEVD